MEPCLHAHKAKHEIDAQAIKLSGGTLHYLDHQWLIKLSFDSF